MAAQAQEIDLVLLQHALIRRPVRRVADNTPLLQRFMLVHERALFLRVAI
jgi:putative NIF3 family GTP cyclohydrolase 1 type 2